jgi:hypothetical protein
MKIKTLIILVILLGAIYAAFTLLDVNQKESTIDASNLQIDTTQVVQISFNPEMINRAELILKKESGTWHVIQGEKSFPADIGSMERLLTDLSRLKINRMVGKDATSWSKFELEAQQVTKVSISSEKGLLISFYIGGFDFDQQTQQPLTYIRIEGDDRSYLVNGYLLAHFNRDITSYRNRLLMELVPEQVTNLAFSYPADSSFTLSNNNGLWFVNHEPADSKASMDFVSSISYMQSPGIISETIELEKLFKAYSIVISGNEMANQTIDAYTGHPAFPLILSSSLNKETLFDGTANQLFEQIFASPERFKTNPK